jgi:hypothetical protein
MTDGSQPLTDITGWVYFCILLVYVTLLLKNRYEINLGGERDSLMTWVSHILGRSVTVVVSMWWWEGLRWVLLMTLTCGRLLVLGVNQLQRSDVVDLWMGVITGNYSRGNTLSDGKSWWEDVLGRLWKQTHFDVIYYIVNSGGFAASCFKTITNSVSLRSSMQQLVWCLMHMWTSDEEVDICLVHVVRRRNPLSQYHHVRYRLMYEWSRESF